MRGKIALEEHFLCDSPEHFELWRSLVPGIPEQALVPMRDKLTDLGAGRLEEMDRAGIELAVLSSVASVQGTQDAALATRIAREANDLVADSVRERPDRYAGFASVPLQDPEAGADELERAVRELGLLGAMLFGHTDSAYLDEDCFTPFWERVEELGVPVYLHAADGPAPSLIYAGRPELLGPTWSWTAETAAHALRIILGGVFERFPKARLILGHMGETLPFFLWRLDSRIRSFQQQGPERAPSEVLREHLLVTTAGAFSDEPLLCALAALGEDSVMFSVDHPFENSQFADTWLEQAPLSAELRNKVAYGNARACLGLGDADAD
jgi:2,3-dihydroxybenzoate decarboxylase